MRIKLYIGGLAPHTTERDLHDALGTAHTDILGIFLLPDPKTDRHRGFGFIELATQAAAEAAATILDGQILNGRRLSVSSAGQS